MKSDESIIQFTKGAPDEVLKCRSFALINDREEPLTDEIKAEILKENKSMADKALRVLCGAYRKWKEIPDNYTPEYLEKDLCYIGLSGMIDPIRPEASS